MEQDFKPGALRLVIGIGNPGNRYAKTYHNVGEAFIEYLEKAPDEKKFWLAASDSHMNASGPAVLAVSKKRRAAPATILIAHDDADLPLGTLRLQFGRGAAGHRGVASVIESFGTKNFWRLRIGIRDPREKNKAGSFVLKKISPAHQKILDGVFEEGARLLAQGKTSRAGRTSNA